MIQKQILNFWVRIIKVQILVSFWTHADRWKSFFIIIIPPVVFQKNSILKEKTLDISWQLWAKKSKKILLAGFLPPPRGILCIIKNVGQLLNCDKLKIICGTIISISNGRRRRNRYTKHLTASFKFHIYNHQVVPENWQYISNFVNDN